MKAVEILAEEHRDIAFVLACLEQLVQSCVRADALDGEASLEILEYLEQVADGSHQDKEERVVFPRLLACTRCELHASIEGLLGDHERERDELERLRASLEGAAYGDPFSRDCFVLEAREYVSKLLAHARWEDRFLWPLVEQHLGEAEDAEMLVDYRALEQGRFGGSQRDAAGLLARVLRRFEGSAVCRVGDGPQVWSPLRSGFLLQVG